MNKNIKKFEDYSDYVTKVKEIIGSKELGAYVFTFGCQQNEADSEKIRGLAEKMGYKIVDKLENAHLIILNTCAIRDHAEAKALSMLGNFKRRKREVEDIIIGVMGCMAAEPHVCEMLKNDFHYVDFTIEPNMIHSLPYMVYSAFYEGKRRFVIGEDDGSVIEGLPIRREQKRTALVSIMYGCNNFCTYCIVPYVRGRERSRSSDEIIAECKYLIENGTKEIMLLGQNVNSYKSDVDFAGLMEKIACLGGDFKLTFMTSHPKDVSDNLINVMAKYSEKILRSFHLPLQSGSDRILKKMNRTYNREGFLKTVERLRSAMPDIIISTDVIVGFPSETEEDFEDTIDMLGKVRFDMVYSFKYSRRKGTPADRFDQQVDEQTKKERLQRLLDFQDVILREKNIIK